MSESKSPRSISPRMPDPLKVLYEILNVLSFSVEVFTRHEFGERYISWLRFILSLVIINSFIGVLRIFHSLPFVGGGSYPQMSSLFWYSFLCLSSYHLFRIWRRNRKGIAWHSRSSGLSHLAFLPLSDAILFRWVEPLLCITASFLLRPISPLTANWLLISSLCLLIKNNIVFNTWRGRVLDVIDGRIESAHISGKVDGKDKRKSAGWSNMVSIPTDLGFESDEPEAAEVQEVAGTDDFAATVAQLMDGPVANEPESEQLLIQEQPTDSSEEVAP